MALEEEFGIEELGEAEAGNLTAKNLLAIADALGVDIRMLL